MEAGVGERNADTERMMRTIKEEVIWVNEFRSLEEAKESIGSWIEVDYNMFTVGLDIRLLRNLRSSTLTKLP